MVRLATLMQGRAVPVSNVHFALAVTVTKNYESLSDCEIFGSFINFIIADEGLNLCECDEKIVFGSSLDLSDLLRRCNI